MFFSRRKAWLLSISAALARERRMRKRTLGRAGIPKAAQLWHHLRSPGSLKTSGDPPGRRRKLWRHFDHNRLRKAWTDAGAIDKRSILLRRSLYRRGRGLTSKCSEERYWQALPPSLPSPPRIPPSRSSLQITCKELRQLHAAPSSVHQSLDKSFGPHIRQASHGQ